MYRRVIDHHAAISSVGRETRLMCRYGRTSTIAIDLGAQQYASNCGRRYGRCRIHSHWVLKPDKVVALVQLGARFAIRSSRATGGLLVAIYTLDNMTIRPYLNRH